MWGAASTECSVWYGRGWTSVRAGRDTAQVRLGVDRVVNAEAGLDRQARIALLTNHAARTSAGDWTGVALRRAGYDVTLFLSPEHGLTTAAAAGEAVGHGHVTGVQTCALPISDTEPVDTALASIDLIVADLPCVGARYYTYPWTIRETMRLAEQHDLPVVVLDRPNPLNGISIEGDLPELDSAVCSSPVPVRHGLTIGELERWNREVFEIDVELEIVALAGWNRRMAFADTGLPFVAPSPALRSPAAIALYPGTCLIEGTNVAEGRGTDDPFALVGAPFVDGAAVAATLRGREAMAGITIAPVDFVPESGKWAGERCSGIHLEMTDPNAARPVLAGLALVAAFRAFPEFRFNAQFDALAGTSRWREALERGKPAEEIAGEWHADEDHFRQAREPVLLYA